MCAVEATLGACVAMEYDHGRVDMGACFCTKRERVKLGSAATQSSGTMTGLRME